MSTELEHIWSQVTAELSETIDEPVYRIWLEPLRAVDLTGSNLTLEAPAQTCGWIRERFGRVLQTCAAAVLGPDLTIDVVESRSSRWRRHGGASAASTTVSTAPSQQEQAARGNPKLTFDQFVIGDSNRLAHAAALAVSELPAQAYNPLFICGPPGVGKTHLLHSIAAFMAAYNPGLRVRSTTGESFTNDFLGALGSGRLDKFKASFRHVDVLLIDDVQFLERKTKTEEEFFHTFNVLYDADSQIVLTSDRPPSDLRALEDRLRERFQSGLVADIRPPDFPTRLAILRKRAQHDGIELVDPHALEIIAERITINVRTLEGALIRAVAFSSLTGRPLSAELAGEVLDGLYPKVDPPAHSIAEIKAAACAQFGISVEELVSPVRSARVAWPRQVAMYLARELTQESLPTIGREFGGRDHTTVLYAWRRTAERMSTNISSRAAVDELRTRLTTPPC
ncbi:MAG TPA: chromosomal replication initiator protein DnaA [Solirubrobacteraceae bacterium]|nr:chromosomal replication initiator protein DnaA [Solirubrobacteraceae bacterium]